MQNFVQALVYLVSDGWHWSQRCAGCFLIGPWQASRFFWYLKLSVKLSDCVSSVYNSYLHAWGNFRACSEIWSNRSSMSAKVFTSPEVPVRCASPLASPLNQYGSSALTNRDGKVPSYITWRYITLHYVTLHDMTLHYLTLHTLL